VPARLNPLDRLRQWRSGARNSEKLYGAIVAQARLPIFYRSLGVPDTLEGRHALLSLHLFAALNRLRAEAPDGPALAQELVDRFSRDMETVLRELGVSDIRIPKTMRGLAAASVSQLHALEKALPGGEASLAAAIEAVLPKGSENAELTAEALASYLGVVHERARAAEPRRFARGRDRISGGQPGEMSKMPKAAEREPELGPPPLRRILRVDDIKDGEERSIAIGPAEREEIANLLDLVALDDLRFTFHFDRRGEGRLVLRGTLNAAVTQTCVVSLDPVPGTLEVPIEIEFWPRHLIEDGAEMLNEAVSQLALDWPETIVDGRIDLGPVIYETLATGLDPYPKRPGISFEWAENGDSPADEKLESPFAALKNLK
jgi:uncharacterized metal-binding protein YceD (DUF177 family)